MLVLVKLISSINRWYGDEIIDIHNPNPNPS